MTDEVANITHLVQMAMTPAFMLAGMGAVASLLAGRLTRAVDRERKIVEISTNTQDMSAYRYEMQNLKSRCFSLITGLYFSTLGWFCICGVVLTIFISYIFNSPFNHLLISWLFSIAMIAIIISVALLMWEVHLSYLLSKKTDWEFLER